MRAHALRFATIAVAAILAAAACGGPDAAEVAVHEFCDELKYLIREQRLERIDDRQFVEAYGDLLESLMASGDRVGRPLGSTVETKCPAASSDAERIEARIALVVDAQPAQLQQQRKDLERLTQTDNASDAAKPVTSLPGPAMTTTPNASQYQTTETPTVIDSPAKTTELLTPTLRTHISSLNLPGENNQERILFYANVHDDEQSGIYVLSTNSGEATRLALNVPKDNADQLENIHFWPDDFDLSSDKRHLVVSRGPIIDDETDGSEKGLFIIALSSRTMEQVSEPPQNCNDLYPLWSPTGDAILFEEICEGGEGGIRRMGIIHIAQKARTYINDIEKVHYISRHDLEFSPDGNTIIGFISYTHDGTSDGTIIRSIMIYSLTGSGWQEVPVNDANNILGDELAQLKLNSKVSPLISATSHNLVGERSLGGVYFNGQSLSRDGNSLAVRGSITDSIQEFRKEFVSILDVRTGNIEKLIFLNSEESGTRSHHFDGKPSWSPDGQLIALRAGTKLDSVYGYIIDVKNESIRPLSGDDGLQYGLRHSGVTLGDIAWSKDSSHILIGVCASSCGRGDFKNAIRVVHVSSGEYRVFHPGTEGQIHRLQWLSEANQAPPPAPSTPIVTPTSLSSALDGKAVDELRTIVHDEFGKITLSLAQVFVHYDSEKQRPLAVESMRDAIDSCLISKDAIEQLGIVDTSYALWPRVAENVGRYCDHLVAASNSLVDWNLIRFKQAISNAMSALDDAAADVPRL